MANLLTLALVEMTRSEYEVAAWDLDTEQWVLLKSLPISPEQHGGEPVWDLFQVTKAEIERDYTEQRSSVYKVRRGTSPAPQYQIDRGQRLDWLDFLSDGQTVETPRLNHSYVTLVEPDAITDIIMTEKDSQSGDPEYDLDKPFFWESRLEFEHQGRVWGPSRSKVGVACKDLRWKTYWHMIAHTKPTEFLAAREKWLRILNQNRTFLVVEYYNDRTYVASGVHSILVQ